MLAIGCFGLVVLYSAAGGSIRPWALSQGIRFFVFLARRDRRCRACRETSWRRGRLPAYVVLLVVLIAVELLGAVARRQPALARPRLHPPAAVRADEAGDRARLRRFYDMLPPGETRRFGAIWPAAVLIGVPAALVMLQPDLGTALMITRGRRRR